MSLLATAVPARVGRRQSEPQGIAVTMPGGPHDLVADASVVRALQLYARCAALCAMAVGAAVLAGWALDIAALKSVLPGFPTMKPNTAAGLLSLGTSLWLLRPGVAQRWHGSAGIICALIPLIIGGLTLAEYAGGWDFGIDQLLMKDDPHSVATSSPGRPSPMTALELVLLGAGLMLIRMDFRNGACPAQYLGLAATFVALLGFLGYLYGATIIRVNPAYTSMALHTAVTFLVLSTGLLAKRSDTGMMRLLTRDSAGGILARRLIPTVIGFAVTLGWLRLQAQRAGLIDTEFGLVIMVSVISVFVTAAATIAALAIDRVELHRRRATEATKVWASVFEHAEWGVALRSADGQTLQMVNPAFARMHGYTVEELAGHAASDLNLSENLEKSHAAVQSALESGQCTLESLRKRKDGSTFPALVNLTALRNDEGRVMTLAANVQDITILKRAEERVLTANRKLEAAGHRLALALRSGEIGVWDWDVLNDHIVWDEQMYQLYGVAPDQPVNYATWRDAVLPEDLPAAEKVLQDTIAARGTSDNRFRIHHPQLGVRYIEASEEVMVDESNTVVRVVGVNKDVTAQRAMEESLRQSEERLRLSFEHSAVGAAIVSLNGHFLSVNQALCKMVGYEAAELTTKDFQSITHVDDLAADLDLVRRLLAGEIPSYQMEKRYLHKLGAVVWIRLSVALVRDGHDQPVHFVVHVEDITERKKAEAHAAAASKELESFSYSVAHDLRAPLRAINGFTQILVKHHAQGMSDDAKECFAEVCASSKRMGQLIDDLLSLSQVGRAALVREDVDLSEMAREISGKLQQSAPAREAEFVVQDGLLAQGDRRLIMIALENLLGNAWKYTGKHARARIEVGAVNDGSHNGFFVRDDGDGFDMAYAGKLFGAFQRLHSADDFEGTGIGLATVQRIVQRHGGSVRAEGKPGAGATFYVTLS